MQILLLESTAGVADRIKERLELAGHRVSTCADEETGSPCRSVRRPSTCPLDDPTDLAIVARHTDAPDTLLEMGAVCAERHRVPVIHIDPADTADLEHRVIVAAAAGRDIAEAKYAAVVRSALADEEAAVEANRDRGRVRVLVQLPEPVTPLQTAAIADRARAAIREYDRFVRIIDVSVEHPRG